MTGLLLPSCCERVLKVSETFFRLNGDPAKASAAQARWLAIKSNSSARTNRLVRAQHLVTELGWTMTTVQRSRRWWIESDRAPNGCHSMAVMLGGTTRNMIADHQGLWGKLEPTWPTVHLFTDGSWHPPTGLVPGVSSWAVCVRNDWLNDYHTEVEPEGSISARTRAQSVVFGGRIDESTGVGNFDAELTAIARALMSVPVKCSVSIHTDSMSSIQAIDAYRNSINHRARLRMAGRPLLAIINKVIIAKATYSATTSLQWVRAHSTHTAIEHVGNRLADDMATRVCNVRTIMKHRIESSLMLAQHEAFVAIHVPSATVPGVKRLLTTDPRRAASSSVGRPRGRGRQAGPGCPSGPSSAQAPRAPSRQRMGRPPL